MTSDTYLPAFEALVKAMWMRSGRYNRVYPPAPAASCCVMCCAARLGFKGYVVSGLLGHRRHLETPPYRRQAQPPAALAVRNGTELECGPGVRHAACRSARLISEAEIDDAATRLFTARMRLGMFDPPERVRWARIPASVNQAPAHDALASRPRRRRWCC